MLDKISPSSAAPDTFSKDEERDLLELEARYCSYGDTVHYTDVPKIFERCEGSFIYDGTGTPFLDLQMWYSAVNFGYANPRLNNALKRQIDRLPRSPRNICTARRSSWRPPSGRTPSANSAVRAGCISTSAARRRSRIR